MKHLKYEVRFRHPEYRHLQMEPVLVDRSGRIIAGGKLGETHYQIFHRALIKARNDKERIKLIDALANDAQHRFEIASPQGRPIFGENGRPVTVNRMEAGKIADACGLRPRRFGGTPLQSQHISEMPFGVN